jgi:hypothetical protein
VARIRAVTVDWTLGLVAGGCSRRGWVEGGQGDETSLEDRYRKMRKKHPTRSGDGVGGDLDLALGSVKGDDLEWEVRGDRTGKRFLHVEKISHMDHDP